MIKSQNIFSDMSGIDYQQNKKEKRKEKKRKEKKSKTKTKNLVS